MAQHFLSVADRSATELRALITRGIELKQLHAKGTQYQPLDSKVLAMVFEKSSTRTRVSFETAMVQLGGHALFLSPHDTHLGRGEPIEDMARVLSKMVDGVILRTFAHSTQQRFARYCNVPVLNGLSDLEHPCQLLADMLTWFEQRGDIAKHRVCWLGDGNNMCNSYIVAAGLLGFELRIACPPGYEPDPKLLASAGAHVSIGHDPIIAAQQADIVTTDVWASMGQETQHAQRREALKNYQVNADLMACAAHDAMFLHCLPAHRGEEVSAEVIDGPQSHVWEQAGNRLHAQKALLEQCMT